MNPAAPDPQRNAGSSLWSQAPGWRNLATGAGLLTAIAVALPLALPEQAPPPLPAAAPPAAPTAKTTAPVQPPPALPAPVQTPRIVYVPKYIPTPAPVTPAPSAAANTPAPAPAPAQKTADVAPTPEGGVAGGSCRMTLPMQPMRADIGLVTAFEDHDVAQARNKLAGLQLHGEIDPQYADGQSVMVRMPDGKRIIPMYVGKSVASVRVGDRVAVQNRYRSPSLPCNYVPNLVTADLGPPPPKPAGASVQAVSRAQP